MADQQQTLVELAREDARLFQIKQLLANLPRRIQELGKERLTLELQAREAEGRWQNAESARRKLENELSDARAKKAKSESRLAAITSTDQYQALTKEIITMGERIDALESQVLEALERSEETERQRDAEKARVDQGVGALDAQKHSLEADLARARANLEEQTRKREAALVNMSGPLRLVYDRILKSKGDAALAIVNGQTCGICKGVQPPHIVQQLRAASGVHHCQMCGRILVWDSAFV
jgi:predicted  nucleic acid-binding Zn-ribbon protein